MARFEAVVSAQRDSDRIGRRQAAEGNGHNDNPGQPDDPRRRPFVFWSAAARRARTDGRGRAM